MDHGAQLAQARAAAAPLREPDFVWLRNGTKMPILGFGTFKVQQPGLVRCACESCVQVRWVGWPEQGHARWFVAAFKAQIAKALWHENWSCEPHTAAPMCIHHQAIIRHHSPSLVPAVRRQFWMSKETADSVSPMSTDNAWFQMIAS